MRKAPNLAKKFVILTDTMSDVAGGPSGPGTTPTFGELAQPIYDEAKALGVRFSTTAIENLLLTLKGFAMAVFIRKDFSKPLLQN